MIAEMLSNKKFNQIVSELFIRVKKINIFLFLSHNLISKYKCSAKLYTIFYYENDGVNKSHLISHQKLIMKTL